MQYIQFKLVKEAFFKCLLKVTAISLLKGDVLAALVSLQGSPIVGYKLSPSCRLFIQHKHRKGLKKTLVAQQKVPHDAFCRNNNDEPNAPNGGK